jgi:hypothetical protein
MKPTSHPIRCRCGQLEGAVAHPARGIRGVCYCRDCQAYAHFLERPDGMVDALGGTDVVIARPHDVRLTAGLEHLACMSLSPRGTLRWYASCCRTPIANTPREVTIPHLGLVHSALEGGARTLDEAFGPIRMRVNRKSAHGAPPPASVLSTLFGGLRYAYGMLSSRLGGKYRNNPFFDASGQPRMQPRVLTLAEREMLNGAVQHDKADAAHPPADR